MTRDGALYPFFRSQQMKRSAGQSAIATRGLLEPGSVFAAATMEKSADYTKKGGVIASEIMLPPHAPEIYS